MSRYEIGELIISMDREPEYRYIEFACAPSLQLFFDTIRGMKLLNSVWYPSRLYVFSDPLKDQSC